MLKAPAAQSPGRVMEPLDPSYPRYFREASPPNVHVVPQDTTVKSGMYQTPRKDIGLVPSNTAGEGYWHLPHSSSRQYELPYPQAGISNEYAPTNLTPSDLQSQDHSQEWTSTSSSNAHMQLYSQHYPNSWGPPPIQHSNSWYGGGGYSRNQLYPRDASNEVQPSNAGNQEYSQYCGFHTSTAAAPSSSSTYPSPYWIGYGNGHDWNHQYQYHSQRPHGPVPCETMTTTASLATDQESESRIKPPSTEVRVPPSEQQQHGGEYINPSILDLVDDLNLPQEGRKFSTQKWKDALLLLYRWRTTTNDRERMLAGASMNSHTTANAGSGTAACSTKSVKSFCEKVLKQRQRRRQFSIHWKDTGLKRLLESDHDVLTGRRPTHDDPQLQTVLDDYFSGRKRTVGYQMAKEKALDRRQRRINKTYDDLTRGTALKREQLFVLQNLIEEAYEAKVEIELDGQRVTHHVSIDGFGGWPGSGTKSISPHSSHKHKRIDESSKADTSTIASNDHGTDEPPSDHPFDEAAAAPSEECCRHQQKWSRPAPLQIRQGNAYDGCRGDGNGSMCTSRAGHTTEEASTPSVAVNNSSIEPDVISTDSVRDGMMDDDDKENNHMSFVVL